MKKYEIGEILADKENSDVFYKILAIASELDFEGYQCYFVEVWDKGNKYYVSYDHVFLNAYTERSDESDSTLEFI